MAQSNPFGAFAPDVNIAGMSGRQILCVLRDIVDKRAEVDVAPDFEP